MSYVNIPNIPQKPVKLAVVDGRIGPEIEESLQRMGIKPVKTYPLKSVHTSVAFHPDIMLHHIRDELIVCAPDIDDRLTHRLSQEGFRVIMGNTPLSGKYPGDIAYNVARVGRFAFHNLKYTDPVLKEMVERSGAEFIHINQGYSKCSVSLVNDKCIITADKGIAKAAERVGIEVLLIEPDEGILLPGLDSGFIGGSTGLVSKNQLAIAGDVEKLKSSRKVMDFLYKKGISIICLSDAPITDIGSIIPLLTI